MTSPFQGEGGGCDTPMRHLRLQTAIYKYNQTDNLTK